MFLEKTDFLYKLHTDVVVLYSGILIWLLFLRKNVEIQFRPFSKMDAGNNILHFRSISSPEVILAPGQRCGRHFLGDHTADQEPE